MNKDKYVFSVLSDFLDRSKFSRIVAKCNGDMELEVSVYETFQILSISLTDKTPLRDLFDKQNFNNVNELNGSSEPSLFQNLIY